MEPLHDLGNEGHEEAPQPCTRACVSRSRDIDRKFELSPLDSLTPENIPMDNFTQKNRSGRPKSRGVATTSLGCKRGEFQILNCE